MALHHNVIVKLGRGDNRRNRWQRQPAYNLRWMSRPRGKISSEPIARCTWRAAWTTVRFCSSGRARSISRSAARDTKPCKPPPASRCGPGTTGFISTIAIARLSLMLGVTAEQTLLGSVGAGSDPNSGGRQMPSHWSSPELHIVSGSSPTGTQFVQAVGCAQAYRYLDPGVRRSDAGVERRRRHQRGRILGIVERRVSRRPAAGVLDPGQRLRHLGSGGTANRRRQHRAIGGRLSRIEAPRSGWYRFRGVVPGHVRSRGACPGAQGSGVGARHGHAPVFAFALR